jgi:maltose alpha-D-glucosyltransferase/alpha-amylase
LLIHDFGGNFLKPFSERRLRRSPLRDLAAMINSFYYVALNGFLNSPNIHEDEQSALISFADLWAHYMSGFFIRAYTEETKGFAFIPESKEDTETLINCYLLERSLQWLNYELNHHTEKAAVMLQVIRMIMKGMNSGKVVGEATGKTKVDKVGP